MKTKNKIWPLFTSIVSLLFLVLFIVFAAVKCSSADEVKSHDSEKSKKSVVNEGGAGTGEDKIVDDTIIFDWAADLLRRGKYFSEREVSAYALLKPYLARKDKYSVLALRQIEKIVHAAGACIDAGAWKLGLEMLISMQDSGSSELDGLVNANLKKVNEKYRKKARLLMDKYAGKMSVDYLEKALRADPDDLEAQGLLVIAKEITGTLDIFCNPACKVKLDGVDTDDIAPIGRIKLLAGKHNLILIHESAQKNGSAIVEFDISYNNTTRVIYEKNEFAVINE